MRVGCPPAHKRENVMYESYTFQGLLLCSHTLVTICVYMRFICVFVFTLPVWLWGILCVLTLKCPGNTHFLHFVFLSSLASSLLPH